MESADWTFFFMVLHVIDRAEHSLPCDWCLHTHTHTHTHTVLPEEWGDEQQSDEVLLTVLSGLEDGAMVVLKSPSPTTEDPKDYTPTYQAICPVYSLDSQQCNIILTIIHISVKYITWYVTEPSHLSHTFVDKKVSYHL